MDKTRECKPNRAFSRVRRVLVLGVTVPALLLFAGAVSQANAAPKPAATMTTMQSMQKPDVLGVCTTVEPNTDIFEATGDTFTDCSSCVSIGQLGEDNDRWENFWCWELDSDLVLLYVQNGPEISWLL